MTKFSKTYFVLLFGIFFILKSIPIALAAGAQEQSPKSQARYVEGEIMVKFKEGIPKDEAANIIQSLGCRQIKHIDGLEIYCLSISSGKSVAEMVDLFQKDPRVKYAQPNYICELGAR